MLIPGSIDADGEWQQAQSLARSIEQALVGADLIDLAEEGEEATLQRRQTLVALSDGIIGYLKGHLEIELAAGDLRSKSEGGDAVPGSLKTFPLQPGNQIEIGTGSLRTAAAAGIDVPVSAKTLTGKVK